MARKLRIEYPGAVYHVINRGNYRAGIFAEQGARRAFMECLVEACARARWTLHAYVLMSNHYHFLVETPEGNLVAGMQWLQSTFANRFNRFRGENGHVFQGRYKAILVEGGEYLGAVAHYIHLNPVRAGLFPVERLGDYTQSSYRALLFPKERPACLHVESFLSAAGDLQDTTVGRRKYKEYLAWVAENEPAQKQLKFEAMSKGWAVGTEGFKRDLAKEHRDMLSRSGTRETSTREARELLWRDGLERVLKRLHKTKSDLQHDIKAAPWKIAVAAHLKAQTTVTNVWLAEHLNMGAPDGVSRYVGELRHGLRPKAEEIRRRLTDIRV